MKKKLLNIAKVVILILIVCAFVWFLLIKPKYTFSQYEKKLEEAGKRYFEINSSMLPTGKRIATVKMIDLFQQSYLKEDMYIPYSKTSCSTTNSWVKVKKENNEYKYYVYLECGAMKSSVDHEGPIITLNGKNKIEVEVGTEYKDQGVKSVIDKSDGEKDKKEVEITGEVDTTKQGIYKINYTAYDSFKNKTVVTREVTVVKTAHTEIKKKLGDNKVFTGNPDNNYINISKMDFRIVGLDDNNNIIVVADNSVAYINGNKIDKWINDYYYNLFNNKAKKMIVESKFCNKTESTTSTKCTGYTEKKKIYIPSISDVNKTSNGTYSFIKDGTYTWLAETDGKNRYKMKNSNGFELKSNKTLESIKPMFVIDGKQKIISGTGTKSDPYLLKDYTKLKANESVSKLQTGDIINNKGTTWRVIQVEKDESVKVVYQKTLVTENVGEDVGENQEEEKTYDPTNKNSRAYGINNQSTKYINTKILEKHTISVPIYKNKIIYGKEIKHKEYKVLLAAPNAFEMYSTQTQDNYKSYWLINSSQNTIIAPFVDYTSALIEQPGYHKKCKIKVTGYISKKKKISSGSGLAKDPYRIG